MFWKKRKGKACPTCKGWGSITKRSLFILGKKIERPCPQCHGTGKA